MPRVRSDDVAARFGENLRRVRRREGLSQEQLSVRASLHRTEVGRLEGGERTCRIDTLLRLAGAMAARPEELLDGIVWVPAPETQGSFSFNSRPPSISSEGQRPRGSYSQKLEREDETEEKILSR